MLNRILGCQDKKGIIKRICGSTDRDLPFLHGFKERALDFGRGTVYLVCEDDIGENGSLFRVKIAFLLVVDECTDEVRGQ